MAPRPFSVSLALAALVFLFSLSATTVVANIDDGVQWLPGHDGDVVGNPPGDGTGDGTGDPDEVAVLVVPPDQLEFYTAPVDPPDSRRDRIQSSITRIHEIRFFLSLLLSMR